MYLILASRYLVMKLFYYDDVTPPDYEPPFFRPATDGTFFLSISPSFVCTYVFFYSLFLLFLDEAMSFHAKPLRFNLGKVDTPYHSLSIQIRTAIDCVEKITTAWNRGETKVWLLFYFILFY